MNGMTLVMPRQLVTANTATKVMAVKIVSKLTSLWVLLMGLLFTPNQPVVKGTPQIAPPAVVRAAVRSRAGGKAAAVQRPKVITRKLRLHSFKKDYTCVFTGKVVCGDSLCQKGQVRLRVASRQNPSIVKTAPIQADGTYELSVLLTEYLHEHVDWSILADSPDSEFKQINGRQILMDDSTITIEESIQLL